MPGGAGPKRIGSQWERDVRDYLRACGMQVDRRYGAGRHDDDGDLVIVDHQKIFLECKAGRALDLGPWLRVARDKAGPHRTPIVVVKRRSAKVHEAFAVTDLRGAARLITPLL